MNRYLVSVVISMLIAYPVFAQSLKQQFKQLEQESGGRLGVFVINTSSGKQWGYRANERFPTGCTSKVVGVAATLKKSMNDQHLLSKKITYQKADLTNWNPITEQHMNEGMTVAELAEAAIRYSDNTAMNLLLLEIGGTHGMTTFARSLGDTDFRQDHAWPDEALSGGKGSRDDSSTPKAMATLLRQLVLGNELAISQRNMLKTWLQHNTTGNARIRAGLPQGWVVGDKTGTGFYYGTTNDIAIIWPPHCAPIVLSMYYTNDNKAAKKRDDILAKTTRIVINELAQQDRCIGSLLKKA